MSLATPLPSPDPKRRGLAILVALSLLYTAQGIPFGFATEYLPVALREQGYSYTAIAGLFWLQLPWQAKVLWAKTADAPGLRPRTRQIILVLQMGLALTVAGFAIAPLASAPVLWFALTALAALFASTQDVFVDAFAVRVLLPAERGAGNTAQVAGYRLGMLIGGAALLVLIGRLGERATLIACAGVVAAASIGAFVGAREGHADARPAPPPRATSVRALLREMLRPRVAPVLVIAATFKLGLHMMSGLLKPMVKDYGWSKADIGSKVVVFGTAAAFLGAGLGGVAHRKLGEKRALYVAVLAQTLVCLPLVAVERLHAPVVLTTVAIAMEHFGSGFGTTVLFAALMSATRAKDAGLHYTILTSANAIAIGLGGLLGATLAQHAGLLVAFVAAAAVSALPALLLPRWTAAAAASANENGAPGEGVTHGRPAPAYDGER